MTSDPTTNPPAEPDIDELDELDELDDDFEDYDPETQTTIRAKWTIDGAATLAEAAARSRAFADSLEAMAAEGWEFEGPVEDDYGNCRRPKR